MSSEVFSDLPEGVSPMYIIVTGHTLGQPSHPLAATWIPPCSPLLASQGPTLLSCPSQFACAPVPGLAQGSHPVSQWSMAAAAAHCSRWAGWLLGTLHDTPSCKGLAAGGDAKTMQHQQEAEEEKVCCDALPPQAPSRPDRINCTPPTLNSSPTLP